VSQKVNADGGLLTAPGVWRRLAAFIYEGVLLFGVVMIAGYLYSSLTQQRHALQGKSGLQAFLFIVLAIYFVWFWSRSGQTVAMKAWHIRLVSADGEPLTQRRALARFVLAWLWFLPALTAVHLAGLRGSAVYTVSLVIGVLAYAALAWLRHDRQFWHDVVCGTRLVHWQPNLPNTAQSKPSGPPSSRNSSHTA
jgi:uncharacterized RDD family membrane protein YckC